MPPWVLRNPARKILPGDVVSYHPCCTVTGPGRMANTSRGRLYDMRSTSNTSNFSATTTESSISGKLTPRHYCIFSPVSWFQVVLVAQTLGAVRRGMKPIHTHLLRDLLFLKHPFYFPAQTRERFYPQRHSGQAENSCLITGGHSK